MEVDPGEQTNLYSEDSEIVKKLLSQLVDYVNAGESVQGKESANDVDQIKLWKGSSRK